MPQGAFMPLLKSALKTGLKTLGLKMFVVFMPDRFQSKATDIHKYNVVQSSSSSLYDVQYTEYRIQGGIKHVLHNHQAVAELNYKK